MLMIGVLGDRLLDSKDMSEEQLADAMAIKELLRET
jgi:hypothetical protein